MSIEARRVPRSATILPLAALLLSSCDSALDTRRAELCRRALPALAAKDTVPEVQRVGRGASRDVVRVDFRTSAGRDNDTRPHWLLCRFESGRDVLVAASTDGGPVTGASLFLLRHYYLDAPAGAGANPSAR